MIEMRDPKSGGEKIYYFGVNDADLERLLVEKDLVLSANRLHPTRLRYVESAEDCCVVVEGLTTTICQVDDDFLERLRGFANVHVPAASFPLPRMGHRGALAYGRTDEECARNVRRRIVSLRLAGDWQAR
jgi:hypothetical protein